MANEPVQIKRYPNRRYYASSTSKYVSLGDIEAMVKAGQTVEIRDSQSGEDMTQTVLTQIIMEQHPEKMSLFPADMLHFMLRSNDAMSGLLGDYFRQSLEYLHFLRGNHAAATSLAPMQWFNAWLNKTRPTKASSPSTADEQPAADQAPFEASPTEPSQLEGSDAAAVAQRLKELEQRLAQLESGNR